MDNLEKQFTTISQVLLKDFAFGVAVSSPTARFFREASDRVSNYREMSVMNSIAQLSMSLCSRLNRGFIAGAQAYRELPILRSGKKNLFVTFVDFYDRLPLFRVLERFGCFVVMLLALVAMYRVI